MNEWLPSREEALQLLDDAGCERKVIDHCIAVSRLSVEIGKKLVSDGIDVNLTLVEVGGLLHDIGRSKTHDIRHAIEGAIISEELGIDAAITGIIKKHVGAGISAGEAASLGLPEDDYIPGTVEEKIVAHADNLTKGVKRISLDERISIMEKKGIGAEAVGRVRALADEIGFC